MTVNLADEMAKPMNQMLSPLHQLHEIDSTLLGVTEQLATAPVAVDRAEREMAAAQQTVEQEQEKVKILKRDVDLKNMDLRSRQDGIARFQAALNQSRTNDEYQGLVRQIALEKKHIGEQEEDILSLWEKIEGAESQVKEQESVAEGVKGSLTALTEARDKQLAELQGQKAELESQRSEAAKAVSPDHIKLYERAFERHGRGAMAVVVDDTCHGCFMIITANDMSRLIGGNEVMLCRTCQRILYIP